MDEERRMIIEMLERGKVNAGEAADLLRALGGRSSNAADAEGRDEFGGFSASPSLVACVARWFASLARWLALTLRWLPRRARRLSRNV